MRLCPTRRLTPNRRFQAILFSLVVLLGFPFFLAAEERDPGIEIAKPGVSLTLIAEHPKLATPTGIDVDERGNVWVVSSHTHFPPKDYDEPTVDGILIFTSDGKRSVFYRKTELTMDLELGPEGWVYLAERDRILRVKDTDGDGRGDLEQTLIVLETAEDYPHNALSGLAWHPSGDLVFGLGENFAQSWTLTGKGGQGFHGTGEGGIFRCHLDGSGLVRLARGMWNPFGMLVRENGEIFATDNDPGERPPCRLLQIVPGGDYGFQRLYGNDAHHPFVCWNGELRGTLPMIHPLSEAPCGIDTLGQGVIVPSWSDHSISYYPLERKGASYRGGRIQLLHGTRFFRPSCIARDESASTDEKTVWYLNDWVDGRYQLHGYGRLWKLVIDHGEAKWVDDWQWDPPTPLAKRAEKLRTSPQSFTTKELFEAAGHEDPYISNAALRALAKEIPAWTFARVQQLADEDRVSAVVALRFASLASQSAGKGSLPCEEWAEALLVDESRAVQFETLRWIADAQLKEHLPKVKRFLGRSDLSYRLLEAAVAAWNTLHGKAKQGVRNTKLLLARVRDDESSPRVRAFALRMLPAKIVARSGDSKDSAPTKITLGELRTLLALDQPRLSLEVIRKLAARPGTGEEMLVALASNPERPNQLRAEAIAGLAGIASRHVDLLLDFAAKAADSAIRAAALRALRGRMLEPEQQRRLAAIAKKDPNCAALVQAVLKPKSLAEDRPPINETDAWLSRLEAVPGKPDPAVGQRIFFHEAVASCADCHRHEGRGHVVGPDLGNLDSWNRAELLQAILRPSLKMAPQYQPVIVVLNDGHVHTGIRRQSSTREVFRVSDGRTLSFDTSEIAVIKELDKSLMPENLALTLTDRELRDLMAFLMQE